MKIAIIYDSSPSSQTDREITESLDLSPDVEDIRSILERRGIQTLVLGLNLPVAGSLQRLALERVDAVFNLCEGLGDDSACEIYVASLLELLGLSYTGTGPVGLTLCHDKATCKGLLSAHGIPTPKHVLIEAGEAIGLQGLEYPVIVKPVHEDGSLGIEETSVVNNDEDLRDRVQSLHRDLRQAAIIEEFIDGREFNVSILGSKPYDFVQIREIEFKSSCRSKVVGFQAKWKKSSLAYRSTRSVEARSVPKEVEGEMKTLAVRCFEILKLRDYGRIDFRVGPSRIPYVIDVNPNPCITKGSGMVLAAQQNKINYEDLIGKIAHYALGRGRVFEGTRSRAV